MLVISRSNSRSLAFIREGPATDTYGRSHRQTFRRVQFNGTAGVTSNRESASGNVRTILDTTLPPATHNEIRRRWTEKGMLRSRATVDSVWHMLTALAATACAQSLHFYRVE